MVADQAGRVDPGVEAGGDGLQAQPQAAQGQHLVEADEVVLGVLTVPARRAPRRAEQTDGVPVVERAHGQAAGLGERAYFHGEGGHGTTMRPDAT
ncbi:hypothetical protein SMD11_1362 [Streptomyces albireticuli]|uniref:Uncharacterized protein n=1 Tax=Streptomyces albireticuli TaxID=1940 RepID=A0A1Z2KY88_9ACTN|nr:hypothetical protein SMD11_1362 [Streptomyces albireticuli]